MLEEGECRGEECLVLVLAFLIPEHLDSGVRNPFWLEKQVPEAILDVTEAILGFVKNRGFLSPS